MKPTTVREGLLSGAGQALGVPALVLFGSMTGYGALAHDTGIGGGLAVLSTILVWGLPGQIAMAELYAAGADFAAVAIAVALANMRFFPMTISLLPTLGARSTAVRLAQSQLMSATSWAFVMRASAPDVRAARLGYHTGFACTCVTIAATATAVGYAAASGLPKPFALALLFLNACFFLLLLLDIRGRGAIVAVITGLAVAVPINATFPDTGLILTGLIGGTVGFLAERRR